MKKDTTHKLTVAAMLSAVAFILMFIEFPIPMLIPAFIKMDFSDLPALLGAFALGPVYGVIISFMKNLPSSLPWPAIFTSTTRAARRPSSVPWQAPWPWVC